VYQDTVRLALAVGAKGLILWHLNQERTDDQVEAMVEAAREAVRAEGAALEVRAAATGMELEL
jgi:ribonuclease BN (tRNA processing enzyme)